ncbi:MAG: hypothetical protein K6U87_02715 [Firmicutes bacterium]|nr:hypothetical protein [Bacillota bacterium]
MPIGNMPMKTTLGTLALILGVVLAAVMLFERKTPGYRHVTTFYGLVGVALAVVGLATIAVGF